MPWERIVTRQAGRIFSYMDWREPLPRVRPHYLNSIIYLYRNGDDAETGVEISGSGFFVGMESSVDGKTHIYAVTNAHVIDDGCPVVRVNLSQPASLTERTFCFSFLVEARSRGGYSGSPVFMYKQTAWGGRNQAFGPAYSDMYLNVTLGETIWVLGVDWGHIHEYVRLIDAVTGNELPSAAKVHAGM